MAKQVSMWRDFNGFCALGNRVDAIISDVESVTEGAQGSYVVMRTNGDYYCFPVQCVLLIEEQEEQGE